MFLIFFCWVFFVFLILAPALITLAVTMRSGEHVRRKIL